MAYSKEVKEHILRRIQNGEKTQDVSNDTGISAATIYRWIKNLQEEQKDAKEASKQIKLLIEQGKLEEVKKIAEKYSNDPIIQSQRVSSLIKEGTKESLEKAIEICANGLKNQRISLKQKGIFKSQLKCARSELAEILIKQNPVEVAKSDEKQDESVLNRIKTKLYFDDVDFGFIEQIKQVDKGLSDWEKTVALLAIYDKQKNPKAAEGVLKKSKKSLKAKIEQALLKEEQPSEEDTQRVKILNQLESMVLSKKPRAFDWGVYDKILGWNLDEKVHEEILAKREAEKVAQSAKQEEIEKQIAQREQEKAKLQTPAKVVEKPLENRAVAVLQSSKKKKVKNVKKEKKAESQGETIYQQFENELPRLKGTIMRKISDAEVAEDRKDRIGDLDKTMIIEEKTALDARARMQLAFLLKKYGMGNVAEQKLPSETKAVNKWIQKLRQIDQEYKLLEDEEEKQ